MTSLPPHTYPARIIMVDGLCKLCHGWTRFILHTDKHQLFTIGHMQSPAGQALLQQRGLPSKEFATFYYIEGERVYGKSEAVFRILRQLPNAWPSLCLLRVIPQPLRDWCYERIARNRYKLFGKFSHCQLPSHDDRHRFLEDIASHHLERIQ
jgi:predicted DCC family thiol-disulfide oxidoreductase YuxK